MSCQCSECVALRDNGDDRSPDDFNPAFDMPRTAREALAVVAAWGDPGTMTFTAEKAKCCAELLRVGNVIEQQDGMQPKVGDSVSIDISTCDEDAGARHFGRIVGYQKEHDGSTTWLCECAGYNQQPILTSEWVPTDHKRPAEPKQTRTRISDGVTRVRNAATGAVVWEKPADPEGGAE